MRLKASGLESDASASVVAAATTETDQRPPIPQVWKEVDGPGEWTADPDFNWVWEEYHKPEVREVARRWWPSRPPPQHRILEEMLQVCSHAPEAHIWLLKI